MESQVRELHSRAKSLADRFWRGEGTHYIDEAIALDRKALEHLPHPHPLRLNSLAHLSSRLVERYTQLGYTADIDEAIALDRAILAHCPQGDSERGTDLSNLALSLFSRFNQLGDMEDLNQAIVLRRDALELRPQDHPDRWEPMNGLAVGLCTRYMQLGRIDDIDEAILIHQDALALCPLGHPDRSMSLNNFALCLYTRYQQLGSMIDLSEAIVLHRDALALRPQGDRERPRSLNNLAAALSNRYRKLGSLEDLDEAIILHLDALSHYPQGHPARSTSLNNLAVSLANRYQRLGSINDLNEAILLHREALVLRPHGHPERSTSLSNLAIDLSTRYKDVGSMDDLNEAITLHRNALTLRPHGHPERPTTLTSLAVTLSDRYKQLGGMEDLNEAIVIGQDALVLHPQGHPNRSMSMNNLAFFLSARYAQFQDIEDLNRATALHRDALALFTQGHPERSMSLDNLAVVLSTRYDQLRDMGDLTEAITLHRDALALRPHGHPSRSMSLNNLALSLSTRYERLGSVEDLDEAIILSQDSLALCPYGHPSWSMSLHNLALKLRARFALSSQFEDAEDIFRLYAQLAQVPQVVSSSDLSVTREWIYVAEDFSHPTVVLAYQTALQFLVHHLASLPSLPQHLPVLKKLTSSLAVDAFSACLRNRSPVEAIELLEQGRGAFWSQLIRLRSPLDDVIASGSAGKTLADEFTRLASLIHSTFNSPGSDQHDRVCSLNVELQNVVHKIRELPGLSRFLLPSLFSELRCAASGGPVIVMNASKYSCDALVVLVDRDPVHIPLSITKEDVRELSSRLHTLTVRAKSMDVSTHMGLFLRQLWDVISPIIDFLETTHPLQSRIWWCPTADFSVLPLHAAGPYRKGQKNLGDLYISSYTPTLAALIRARRPNLETHEKHFLAVGQANATGETELVSVSTELSSIGHIIDGLATFTRIEGGESCISNIAEELGKNQWVHLACHGIANRKHPFESAFALYDGRFTIQRIIQRELENPEFAYLSACHTTVGDQESPDEVIHLAAAMQFAGFRSVIGTMWAVDDAHTNAITSTFYKHMVDVSGRLDYTRAAFALQKTMKGLRRIPFDQRVLYIHLGA